MHQIRYFLAVCDELNFTRAAERCNVAQPSLTRAIKKLEEELGGALFRRERNLTHLTDLGRLMRPHLLQTYQAAEAAKEQAESFANLDKAQLNLGIMCTIGPARVVNLIAQLQAQLPNLELELHTAKGSELVDMMIAGDLDVALIGLPSFPDRLNAEPVYTERYVVGFPPGHRFEEMASVPVAEISQETYLRRINCEFPEFYAAIGTPDEEATFKVRYASEREEWIQAMILSGLGCSFMPEYLPLFPGLKTRVLSEPEVTREVSLVTVAGRQFPPAVSTFVRLARNYDWQARV